MHYMFKIRNTVALCTLLGAATLLSGCSGLPVSSAASDATASSVTRTADGKLILQPISVSAMSAFEGDGIYYFDNADRSEMRLGKAQKNGARPIVEKFPAGAHHGFTWGSGAVAVLRSGQALDAHGNATLTRVSDDTVRLTFVGGGKTPLNLKVKLVAYNLEGHPIGGKLVTRHNTPTSAGYIIGGRHVFPKGAIGYRTIVSTDRDEVLVPTRAAFTGSNSIEAFSGRFTKSIPYCLRYIPGPEAEPVGLRFTQAIEKKTRKNGRRIEEVGQSGEVTLLPVKRNTLFCAAEGSSQLSTATWRLRYVNGTRLIDFSFPDEVNAPSFGILPEHRKALFPAFAEEKMTSKATKGKKAVTTTQVRPSIVWVGNTEIEDAQWRFNRVAADAISEALDATKEKREAWEKENGVTRDKH